MRVMETPPFVEAECESAAMVPPSLRRGIGPGRFEFLGALSPATGMIAGL
ncbi:hypothetical protein Pen01_73560 [Phytomonospora endophytica]|nr:hypothetical protein Pen01_73560 [Phytomonospora endophytica]